MIDHAAALTALRTRLLTVTDIPVDRAWENVKFRPRPGIAFLEEDDVPATQELITVAAQGGMTQETGSYFLRWNGIANTGHSAIRNGVGRILLAFAPGTVLAVGSDWLCIRGNPAPKGGQILPNPKHPGFAACPIDIHWWALTTNTIAP